MNQGSEDLVTHADLHAPVRRRRAIGRIISLCFQAGIVPAVVWALTGSSLQAQAEPDVLTRLGTGKEIFQAGCITCHGPDGKGTPQSILGFEPPPTFPDFTDCVATTREPDHDWKAIITHGGPARGFSEIMPVFGEALTSAQIDEVIRYLRGFCRDSSWPRGDLNLPLALVTEKAFPEDEAVMRAAVSAEGPPGIDAVLVYERRFGARYQVEASVPFSFARPEGSGWRGGVGDIGLGLKRLVFTNLDSGSILSVQGEAVLPTGNRYQGFGSGVLLFEAFAAYGQLLPGNSFLQFQGGVELPTRTEEANRAVYGHLDFGKSLSQGMGFGRMWTPMVELLADRELTAGERIAWDLVPQFQVTLSRRQHLRANIGIRIPLNDAGPRATQVLFYLLWDWFDGGLREGWK